MSVTETIITAAPRRRHLRHRRQPLATSASRSATYGVEDPGPLRRLRRHVIVAEDPRPARSTSRRLASIDTRDEPRRPPA